MGAKHPGTNHTSADPGIAPECGAVLEVSGTFFLKGTKHSGTNHTSADPGIVPEYGAVLDVFE